MSLAYLFDSNIQFQDKSGNNNVNGFLRVYIDNTDDRAVTYKDFNGTLNQADIRLDNNGRAVVIVDDSKTYRLEVYGTTGVLLWTLYPISPKATGINETLEALVAAVKSNTIAIEGMALGKKNKQQAKVISGTPTQTVKSISQNADGEITVEFEDIDFPYNIKINSPDDSIEVGTPVVDPERKEETIPISVKRPGLVKADSADTEPGTLIDKLEVVDNVRDPEDPQDVPLLSLEATVDGQGNRKVAINEDTLRTFADNVSNSIAGIADTLDSMDFDEVPHGSFGSSLNQSPGDGTSTSIQVSIFRPIETTVGDAISWTKTTEIGGEDFGTVTLEPGTYIICSDITCQWVGSPAGTYLPQVGNVLGEPFDFSQQQEVHRRMTNVVTVSDTTQFKMRISFDAATPAMGFWINSAQIVKVAGGMSQTNVAHDSTLTGKGSVAEPLGMNVPNVSQSILAGNVAPAFDPTRDEAHKYLAGESVAYEGKTYTFKVEHYGAWNASDVRKFDVSENLSAVTALSQNIINLSLKASTTVGGLVVSCQNDNAISIAGTTSSAQVDVNFGFPSKTLEAGLYSVIVEGSLSFSTAFVYLGGYYSPISTYGIAIIDVKVSTSFNNLLMRFTTNSDNVSVSGKVSILKGAVKPWTNGLTTAQDSFSRKFADLIYSSTQNKVIPVFVNGTLTSGNPDYSSVNKVKQWITNDRIYHVKKGSYIRYKGADTLALFIVSYTEGHPYKVIYSGAASGAYFFGEDTNVRFLIRYGDYSGIVPQVAFDNFEFCLFSSDEQKNQAKITFFGLDKGTLSSGFMALVQLPSGKNMLVDSHYTGYAETVTNRLVTRGVRRIDYYVQTHYHNDHSAILNILEDFAERVDIENATVFLPPHFELTDISQLFDPPDVIYNRQIAMEDLFTGHNCTIVRPDSTTKYYIDENLYMLFYNTDHSIYSVVDGPYYSTNYNDWSICPQIFFGNKVINIAGDIGPIGQRAVAGTCYKADILAAPHHGWDNGVNNLIPGYINNVCPDVVISVNGSEHMPNNDFIASMSRKETPMQSYCEANGVPNYPTCLNGPIAILFDSESWRFDGKYTRYIRNDKNWSYTDNSEHIES